MEVEKSEKSAGCIAVEESKVGKPNQSIETQKLPNYLKKKNQQTTPLS